MAIISSSIHNKYLRCTLPVGAIYRLFSESGIVLGGQLASGIAGVAAVSYFSSLLPPSEYGLLTLALLSVVLSQTIFWGVGAALVRFFGTAFDNGTLKSLLNAVWGEQIKRTMLLTAIGTVCLILLFIFQYSSDSLWLAVLVFLAATFSCYGNLCDQLHTAVRSRMPVALHQTVVAWLKVLFVGGVVYFFDVSARSAMAGICIAVFVVAVWQWLSYSLKRKSLLIQIHEDPTLNNWVTSVSHFSTPFIFWHLAIVAQQSADRWALHWNCSSADLGSYSAVFGITFIPVMLLFQCAMQVARPIFFRNAGNEGDLEKQLIVFQQGAEFIKLTFIGMLLITFIAYFFSGLIVSLLLDSRYWSAKPLVPLFVLSGCLAGISQIIELQMQVIAKSRVLAFIRIVNSAISIIGVFLAARFFGMYGVGIVTVLSQVTIVVALFFVSLIYYRHMKEDACRQYI